MSELESFTPLLATHLNEPRRGKVRDTYTLSDSLLLACVSDRISIFDFVLNAEIPSKGEVLNALNIFWKRKMSEAGIPNDLIAFGKDIDQYLPEHVRGNPSLWRRATVVRRLDMVPVECIGRNILTGSALAPYRKTGELCGTKLPPGLENGDFLPVPLFTPSTKAEKGHDEHLDAQAIDTTFPGIQAATLDMLAFISAFTATRGIYTADFKGEGQWQSGEPFVWGDEIGTPDSCRFFLADEFERRERGKLPTPYDKQFVRNWGVELGIHMLDPADSADREDVSRILVPSRIVQMTSLRYQDILYTLTGKTLTKFQWKEMGVPWH